MKPPRRRSRGRLLRPLFERLVLAGSLLVGLGVIGACAVTGSGATDSSEAALNILGSLAFAVLLVGAVYLLTTMSRDLRRLREHYVDNAATTQTDGAEAEESRADA